MTFWQPATGCQKVDSIVGRWRSKGQYRSADMTFYAVDLRWHLTALEIETPPRACKAPGACLRYGRLPTQRRLAVMTVLPHAVA